MRTLGVLLTAAALTLSGCGDKPADTGTSPDETQPATGEAEKPSTADKADPAAETGGADPAEEAMTPAEYETLLLGLADCAVTQSGIDRKCAGYTGFDAARKARRTLLRSHAAEMGAMGQRHLTHAAPAVRLQAARLASSLFGGDPQSRDALVDAAKAEKDPHVLRAMLRAVRSSIARNDAVRDLLMSMIDHPDEQVRITVLGALAASWARNTEGTLEKVLAAVENDPSPQVRAYACRQLGDRADPKALPLLEKMTAGPRDDPRLYSACFRGLIGMWAAPVPHKKPSEKAYRLTLTRLKATPRTQESPPWAAIANLEWAARPALAKNAPWFDKQAVIEALAELTVDRDAHWLARSGAVKTMAKLGARAARFEKLATAYADVAQTPGTDKQVYEAINEALKTRAQAREAAERANKKADPAEKKPAEAPAEK